MSPHLGYDLVYMRRTNIYLGDAQTAALEQLSLEQGVSRAELVRRLIDQGLGAQSPDQDQDLGAISDSFASLAGALAPETRGVDRRQRHLDRVRGL